MKIMADIMNPQFRVHNNQPANLIPGFKELQSIPQQRIEILQLAVKMNISTFDLRNGFGRQQIGLDADLGIAASTGKYKRLSPL